MLGTSLAAYIDNIAYPNGTAIDWGNLIPGNSYTYMLSVKNTGETTFTVTLQLVDLPIGWTETWDANNTVLAPTEWANGTLSLTVPPSATGGLKSWQSWIRAIG